MNDVRIYIYGGSGNLVKPQGKLKQKYDSVERARDAITTYTHLRTLHAARYDLSAPKPKQYVLAEYTAPYKSNLLEIIEI